jgi:serine/threonine-protein kinase
MGEVYRAHDPRMGRDVAVKISSERFTDRFSREVRAVAALNHPNICQLYDVGPNYLVMELVEGPTLAERIKQGSIPLEEALAIAKQIAEAVESAHEKGIVHRDLKPANIKLRADGTVKVLDFGLAKVAETSDAAPPPEDSPTLTMEAATRAGTILGTAAYMSPAQALGKAADTRADIWSFGAVLYEMLSGQRAFAGESTSDILATVLKLDPDWSALPKKTPAAIRRLIERCLTKDRRQRLQAIGEARIVIEECMSGTPPEIAEPAPARRRIVPWIVAAVMTMALVAISWIAWRGARPLHRPMVRLDVDLGPEVSLPDLSSLISHNLTLSPDGTRLAYVSGNPRRLYMRRLDQSKATEFPGTEDAEHPFFSPDGRWVGFDTRNPPRPGTLNKISVEGGAVVPLVDFRLLSLPRTDGGSWGADGKIIVAGLTRGLLEVPASGGTSTTVLEHAPGESFYMFPQILRAAKRSYL